MTEKEKQVMKRNAWKWAIVPLAMMVVVALGVAGCSGKAKVAADGSTRIAIEVTDKGFVPADFTVPVGKPVTLVVTRRTDRTCVKEIVIADQNIKMDLPLDQAVEVKFTPLKTGEIRYACGMDMVAGKIVVE